MAIAMTWNHGGTVAVVSSVIIASIGEGRFTSHQIQGATIEIPCAVIHGKWSNSGKIFRLFFGIDGIGAFAGNGKFI